MDAFAHWGAHPPLRSRRRTVAAAVSLLTVGILTVVFLGGILSGCGSSDDRAPTTATVPPSDASLGMLAPPGLYDLDGGRTQALGVLEHRDLEGGFWAVVEALPGQSAAEAAVVAVLVGPEDLGVDLEGLEGRFVVAEGRLSDGASIRMAGPELEVDSLQEATDTVVITTETSG